LYEFFAKHFLKERESKKPTSRKFVFHQLYKKQKRLNVLKRALFWAFLTSASTSRLLYVDKTSHFWLSEKDEFYGLVILVLSVLPK